MTDRLSRNLGDKSPAQYMEALRAAESALADFHALRQGFSPPIYRSQPAENRRIKAFVKRSVFDCVCSNTDFPPKSVGRDVPSRPKGNQQTKRFLRRGGLDTSREKHPGLLDHRFALEKRWLAQ